MYDRQLISNRLYSARKDKYLKQEDVGNALNIKQSSYSDLETGKRDMSVPELLTLSELLDVPVLWLLGMNIIPQLTDKECLEVDNYIKYLISKRTK